LADADLVWFALEIEWRMKEGFEEFEPEFRDTKELEKCEDGGVRDGGSEPLEVGANDREVFVGGSMKVAFCE
jgi:hypothetical protein